MKNSRVDKHKNRAPQLEGQVCYEHILKGVQISDNYHFILYIQPAFITPVRLNKCTWVNKSSHYPGKRT